MKYIYPFLSFTLACALTACQPETEESDAIHTADQPEPELELIGSFPDSYDIIIDRVRETVVDQQNRVFIADGGRNKIFVTDQQGSLIDTVGREGSGPGEFESIVTVEMGYDDHLTVYDVSNNRTSVFSEHNGSWEFDDQITVDGEMQGVALLGRDDQAIFRQGGMNPPSAEGPHWMINTFSTGYTDGRFAEPDVIEYKDQPSLAYSEDGNYRMTGLPTLRSDSYAATSDGYIYFMWTDEFKAVRHDINLNPVDTVSAPIPNQPFDGDDRIKYLEDQRSEIRSTVSQHLDDSLPVINWSFHNQLGWEVDPNGYHWLRTFDDPEYLILDPDGNPAGSFDLPEDYILADVNEDIIVAQGFTEEGYHKVKIWEYRLD